MEWRAGVPSLLQLGSRGSRAAGTVALALGRAGQLARTDCLPENNAGQPEVSS